MVQPVKGSGIGAVNIPEILTSKPKILQGLGTAIAPPVEGGGFIGLSEVPASGLPNIMPGETNIFDVEGSGSFTIPTKRGPETLSEFAKSNLSGFMNVFKPGPEDKIRQARARGQIIPGVSDEVEAMAMRDASDARAAADAAGQLAAGQETSRILSEAAKGKVFGEQTQTTTQGGATAQSGTAAGETVPGADTPAKQATVQALDEYLKQARPGVKPKEYADYIKEFSDATGLDVSGQPDNSTALMAFGLALMQNKAGKGFNVGNILSSVGEAGEKALPELTKARQEARTLRAKAGEFAVSRKREDQAAARNRQSVYIVPRVGEGATEKERLQNRLMSGRYELLNSYEIDALATNENFNKNFEFMPGNVLKNMSDLFKGEGSVYSDKTRGISLFGGKDAPKFEIRDPNNQNMDKPSRYTSPTEQDAAEQYLLGERSSLDATEERFQDFATKFNLSKPTLGNKVISASYQALRGLGIIDVDDFGSATKMEDNIRSQQRFLEYVQARYAPQILQEAGKTISDADRQRVAAIVGEIKTMSLDDPASLAAKVNDLHQLVVVSQRAELARAFRKHNNLSGGAPLRAMSEDQLSRYNQLKEKVDKQYKLFDYAEKKE